MDEDDYGIVLGLVGGTLTVMLDLILFAIELTFEAVMLILTVVWGLVCLLLEMDG